MVIEEAGTTNEDLLARLSKALKGRKCPECGGGLTPPRRFNLLVETSLGVVEGEKTTAYLRGEACQNIYLDYQNVCDSMRLKIPFGICQIGKAFRNEITPKQFLFRLREFEQWDLQWFVNPREMEKWYNYWKEERMKWYRELINEKNKVRLRQHEPSELAHYAKIAFDIEYETPFGWKEWEGIHWRSDWDLARHGQYSGRDFTYTDSETGERFTPWIVETSGGVDRTFLFLLLDAYSEEKSEDQARVVLKLEPQLAPYKVAVFPLLANKPDLVNWARKIYENLKPNFMAAWDDRGNIGKRYFSQDEIGTPWCVTIDFQTLKDKAVTVRDRDTTRQERVGVDKLGEYFQNRLK
jgi:glycyl-tRNA synthetase